MTDADTLNLADRMFTAIEQGDLPALQDCYAPDIVVWANFDGKELDLTASLRLVGWLCGKLSDRRYDVTRRELIDGGFLQEHVLRGTAPDGSTIAMPACIVASVADGHITRIHEYLDPSGVAALAS
jgi:ketosteroid isomerase-like protein